MKHSHVLQFRTVALLSLAVFIFSHVLMNTGTAQTTPDMTPDELIARVKETYAGLVSARGSITRIIEYDDAEPERDEGTITVLGPDKLRIDFKGDMPRSIISDGEIFRIFFPGENRGYYTELANCTAGERFILGPGPYKGNILDGMGPEFTYSIADNYMGNIILRADAIESGTFSYILIGIAPETWTIRGVEYFDRNGDLVRQIRFLEFASVDGSFFFPTQAVTSQQVSNNITVETIYITDARLNVPIEEKLFDKPGDGATEWNAHVLGRKR